jgi:uncharacterized protein YbcC (UPF0753/DUF2309 family)
LNHARDASLDARARLEAAIARLDPILPGQAPILNFVHHNTLHGYEHLGFRRAIEEAERRTGIRGYLPEREFRALYARGRIADEDLDFAFRAVGNAGGGECLANVGGRAIRLDEVRRIALLQDLEALAPGQWAWQVEEMNALGALQPDLADTLRRAILEKSGMEGVDGERSATEALWRACLEALGLKRLAALSPAELVELFRARAEALLGELNAAADGLVCPINPDVHGKTRAEARALLDALLDDLGGRLSLRGLLLELTGQDVLDETRPILARFCASHLDEGLAAWRAPGRERGLYAAWRACAKYDIALSLADLPHWRAAVAALPEEPLEAIAAALRKLEIPEDRWEGYLARLALELPGWSGLVNWRAQRPDYPANRATPVALADWLAMRLFFDDLWCERLCRETWGAAAKISSLRAYFERNLSELPVRRALYAGELPEPLAEAAQTLIGLSWAERAHHANWRALGDMIWIWRHGAPGNPSSAFTPHGDAWRLFRLVQHLGLSPAETAALSGEDASALLRALKAFGPTEKGYLWLTAYERHYRERFFAALAANHGRGRWLKRERRPAAQTIFCMDDREESLRRHLEELNPAIETLGAAGFFGVAMHWRGQDDAVATALCPVVVRPAHEVREIPRPGREAERERRSRRRGWRDRLARVFHQEIRRNLLSSHLLLDIFAPGVLAALSGKILAPRAWARLSGAVAAVFSPAAPTRLHLTAPAGSPAASAERPRLGFTDAEQADRVAGFLRAVGLTSGFARLIVLVGHGSISQNNPHLAAYDCGACSGRHGGPNARAFAAMANRPEVRKRLAERGIAIPEDAWFLGAEHNTCNEEMLWFDLEDMPEAFAADLTRLRADLERALSLSAHERCRRFASAPRDPGPARALRHVAERAVDFSQARPELGHATNAAAVIGRRAVTRGAFLDRRVFLISYDPTEDADGKILENVLLAAGPVGAGINLEYYFSTVNNERYGCGSKAPHNVAGLFGVLEGTGGDLRTGLPRQMIEIHEAMRLQLAVEASEAVLTAIYKRQPPLRELIGHGWLLLSAIHPETGEISCFDPERGFIPWNGDKRLPSARRSIDWYQGHAEPLPPTLTAYPDMTSD